MYNIPINFYKRLVKGEVPVSYMVIETHMGYRAYAEKELTGVFAILPHLLDGSYLLDGSITLGSESSGVIEKEGRIISFGLFKRTLEPIKSDIFGSYQQKTLQHMSIQLDNADGKFARLIALEPFIGRPLKYYVGFEVDPQSEHLNFFSGVITEMTVMPVMIIEADEE
jgi:hypothetical protein